MKPRQIVRSVLLTLARAMGSTIRDPNTGKKLGRALFIPWRGKIVVIGLETPVKPTFLPQQRQTYWKHELGFHAVEEPDFPNERRP